MTDIRRLAEKIASLLHVDSDHWNHDHFHSVMSQVESILREAMEEVRKEQHDFEMKLTRPFVLKAYTRAAEVARNFPVLEGVNRPIELHDRALQGMIAAAIEKLI